MSRGAINARLNDLIQKGLRDTDLRKAVFASGYEPTEPRSAQEFGRFIEEDTRKWIDLVQTIGMKAQ